MDTEQHIPNAKKSYVITADQLPLHCPMPDSSLWNSHPQVYLPIVENGGSATCPYCSAVYTLEQA